MSKLSELKLDAPLSPVDLFRISVYVDDVRRAAIEEIAQMAEARGELWVKEGVRLAAGQGNPFPKFAAEIRAKFKSAPSSRGDKDARA